MPSLVEVKEKGMCAVCYNVYTSRNNWRLIAILHFSADKRYIPSKYSSVKFQFDSGKKLSFVGRKKTARLLNLKDILLWRKVLVSAQLNEYMQLRKAYMSGTQGDTNEIQEKVK